MVDEPESLVLEHLRHIRAALDLLREDMRDAKGRLTSIERQVAGVRVDFAHMREDLTRIEHRMDRSDERLERIERRLSLVDPAIPG